MLATCTNFSFFAALCCYLDHDSYYVACNICVLIYVCNSVTRHATVIICFMSSFMECLKIYFVFNCVGCYGFYNSACCIISAVLFYVVHAFSVILTYSVPLGIS